MYLSTAIPEKYNRNNYPNPFNPQTNINFDLPVSAFADLRIYDAKGSEVKTLTKRGFTTLEVTRSLSMQAIFQAEYILQIINNKGIF
ncbi:MAG: T9SS type A sorting domain-containing protein [Ignavibacteria bacterium]|nr:T9SS type A sorting domain-containing protein [Ignavibacteria bacterium]